MPWWGHPARKAVSRMSGPTTASVAAVAVGADRVEAEAGAGEVAATFKGAEAGSLTHSGIGAAPTRTGNPTCLNAITHPPWE